MAITGTDIDRRVSNLLLDATSKRWGLAERIDWINDGMTEIVTRRPAANAVTEVLTCAAGSEQALPIGGIMLLDVIRNINSNDTPGRSIRRVDRQLLDDQDPSWHTLAAQSFAYHFTFDERTPKTFYLYRPVAAGTKIELVYGKLPTKITALSETLTLAEEYASALTSYVCWRALSKDSEYANGAQAVAHYQAFMASIGEQNNTTAAASPNTGSV
jgi:hypothetical protein